MQPAALPPVVLPPPGSDASPLPTAAPSSVPSTPVLSSSSTPTKSPGGRVIIHNMSAEFGGPISTTPITATPTTTSSVATPSALQTSDIMAMLPSPPADSAKY